jgi:oligosaccharyltransferase complex subunit epsilon
MPPTQTKQANAGAKSSGIQKAFDELWASYSQNTASRLKLVDGFLVFIMFSGIFQFLYFGLVTDYPFNAFISGYVLYVCYDSG